MRQETRYQFLTSKIPNFKSSEVSKFALLIVDKPTSEKILIDVILAKLEQMAFWFPL
jgi:hypothetical protein